ncbi:hypothetical protein KY284_001162 [Solanum tuberosum]|nr:hypothetical protein KY284_001162 [Solanum tuberosum]
MIKDYILPCAFSQVGKTISNVVHLLKKYCGCKWQCNDLINPSKLSILHLEDYLRNAIGEGASTKINVIGEATTSSQNNTIGEGESNNNSGQQTLVFLSHSGLEPLNICSTRICESFKSELDPNGINWKSVSEEINDFYLREFKKQFYWDPSIDCEVKILWRKKVARRLSRPDFLSHDGTYYNPPAGKPTRNPKQQVMGLRVETKQE